MALTFFLIVPTSKKAFTEHTSVPQMLIRDLLLFFDSPATIKWRLISLYCRDDAVQIEDA